MSDEFDALLEQKIANMSADDFDALAAKVRPPGELTPKQAAAAAVRKELGSEVRGRATKAKAADAMRAFRAND